MIRDFKSKIILFALVFPLLSFAQSFKRTFQPVYQWSQLEFEGNPDNVSFVPEKSPILDVDVYYSENNLEDKVFVTAPQIISRVPLTLGVVTNKTRGNNPIIAPYPDWSWFRNMEKCNPNRIVSVFRIEIDECDRLWVLDSAKVLDVQVCEPQILAFDLKTNKLISKYAIPKNQYIPISYFVTLKVDVRDTCDDTFVYVADSQWNSLIVYDVAHQTSWRITHKSMFPYPSYGTFYIAGEQFDLMDGIFGLTLSPYVKGRDRILFYQSLSSPTQNWVFTSKIRNGTLYLDNPEATPEIFHTFKYERNTQSGPEATDKRGIVFFGLVSDLSIACWNSNEEYAPYSISIVDRNSKTLQFLSGIKVITNKSGVQEVWIVTPRYQKIMTGTISTKEINFRIQSATVDNLIYGTNCDKRF